ncbi:hypothetical protein Tco_0857053 [Tanacetum coccineum]|uniref:Uncharacterized protein n=1 Tax=Tanacetum coccineum TaxID=301880 RepID=A0ABQ5B547_9ASTR
MEIKQMKKLKASYGVTTPQELRSNHIKEEMSQYHWLSNSGQVEDMTRRLDMCGDVQIACSSCMGMDFEVHSTRFRCFTGECTWSGVWILIKLQGSILNQTSQMLYRMLM